MRKKETANSLQIPSHRLRMSLQDKTWWAVSYKPKLHDASKILVRSTGGHFLVEKFRRFKLKIQSLVNQNRQDCNFSELNDKINTTANYAEFRA